jgi:hypothetical protein
VRRVVLLFQFLALICLMGVTAPAAAQQQIDSSFSDTIIPTLGYPEVEISVGPEGVTAPSTLAAGTYLIRFSSASGYSGYLNFMQPPAGLSEEEATQLALAAASEDLVQQGWVYAGGNNTFEDNVPVTFLIDLAPGEYRVAASYYLPNQGSEEIMELLPLTVTAAGTPGASPVVSPAASPVAGNEPPATVTLEMTDELRYIVSPDPVPSGPQIWKLTNSGVAMSHHTVMVRIPDTVTADQIVAEFNALMSGTPPASESVMAQFTFVGYAALQSGGQTTWVEFDLDPGTYAVICYIIDPMTGRPHVADGMVTVFSVA